RPSGPQFRQQERLSQSALRARVFAPRMSRRRSERRCTAEAPAATTTGSIHCADDATDEKPAGGTGPRQAARAIAPRQVEYALLEPTGRARTPNARCCTSALPPTSPVWPCIDRRFPACVPHRSYIPSRAAWPRCASTHVPAEFLGIVLHRDDL